MALKLLATFGVSLSLLSAQAKAETVIPDSAYAWKIWSETSPVDSGKNVFMTALSRDGVTNRKNKPYLVTVWVACQENATVMTIDFGGIFMSENGPYGTMILRVDGNPARRVQAFVSPDRKFLAVPKAAAFPLMKQMAVGKTLFVRAAAYGEGYSDIYFSLEGFGEKLPELRRACRW